MQVRLPVASRGDGAQRLTARRKRRLLERVFYELVADPSNDERYVAYIVREHRLGRRLDQILRDRYLAPLPPERLQRLLERPDLIHSVATDTHAAREARPAQ